MPKLSLAYMRYFLHIGISLLILSLLFSKVSFVQIVSVVRRSRIDLFLLSVLAGALSIFMSALRWRVLLDCMGYRFELKALSKLAFIGLFFNVYLPGGIVGDVVRTVILPEREGSKEERQVYLTNVATSVVTDRIAGMVGLMLLAFIGFIFCYQLLLDSRFLTVFGSVTLGIIIAFLFLFSRRVQDLVKKLFNFPLKILIPIRATLKRVTEALAIYRENRDALKKVIMFSILAHLCVVGYFFLLASSIGLDINFLKLLAFVPLIEFLSAIPISFGGVGIREAVTILLFSSEGISAAEAMSVSLLSFVVILLLGALGGAFYLVRHFDVKKKER